tara:strand:+ start:580 stop:837 length:258 start_codon:yes stop_codon:yes gene_type:complete
MKGHLLMVDLPDHKKSKPTARICAKYFEGMLHVWLFHFETLQGKTPNPNPIKRTVALTFPYHPFLLCLVFHFTLICFHTFKTFIE